AGGLALALAVCGCSADVAMFRADWNWWSNSRSAPAQQAPPEGLVGPDGQCLPDSGKLHGVALGMTECELINIAGHTDQIEIGANERGERNTVITYMEGERAGIYRFTSGLLVAIERVPEPERPQRRRGHRS